MVHRNIDYPVDDSLPSRYHYVRSLACKAELNLVHLYMCYELFVSNS